MWQKIYAIQQKNQLDWGATDAGPVGKFGALLQLLNAALPGAIEKMLQ